MHRAKGEALVERLAGMEGNPRNVSRIVDAIAAVQLAAGRARTRTEAAADIKNSNSLSMRIRKFHDTLALDVSQNKVAGALYRSKGLITEEASGMERGGHIRCEHVVPVALLCGIVWDRFRHAPLADLGRFLLARAPVAAILRTEDRKLGSWSASHPEFQTGMDASRKGIRPFLRYHGTGIELVYVPDGTVVDLENLTFEEHEKRIASLPLYGGGFLAGDIRAAG